MAVVPFNSSRSTSTSYSVNSSASSVSTSTLPTSKTPSVKVLVTQPKRTESEVELLAKTLQWIVEHDPKLAKRVLQLCLSLVISAADSVQ